MTIIALTGLPRSGKDTFAGFLVEHHGFARLSFAEPLKAAAAVLLDRPVCQCNGFNEDGTPFDREAALPEWGFSMRWFLQRFGTECLRDQIHKDFWITHMRRRLETRRAQNVVITDCRFQNETDMVREMGGIIVEIVRPGTKGSDHSSDARIYPDITVYNNLTVTDLARRAKVIAESAVLAATQSP